ncbi:hypothetical protein PJL18_03317 [Paenarthrobacter nicotinovorans]|nr:hypothetical protein [Paenarthrobacter nicotinovorans]
MDLPGACIQPAWDVTGDNQPWSEFLQRGNQLGRGFAQSPAGAGTQQSVDDHVLTGTQNRELFGI